MSTRVVTSGASAPLGATVRDGGVNFSVFSKSAILVELLLFDDANATQPTLTVRSVPVSAMVFGRGRGQLCISCADAL
jgi:isoamylase